MIADVAFVGLLGTASPSPIRPDRRITFEHSETPLPEHFATHLDQPTSAPRGTPLLGGRAAHIEDLCGAITFAQVVAEVMPVNEELDRRAAQAMRKRAAGQRPRKISQK
jgi:hypothetical protein